MDESRKQFEYEAGMALCLPTSIIELARNGDGYDHAYDSQSIMQPLNGWWHWWKKSRVAIEIEFPSLKQIDTGERYVWSDGVFNFKEDAIEAIRAAGIKVKE
ncbi:hypothetical protein [Enterobacter ludwigii]|uniref:hypothetical protein n=1 Tax=Enterobacter ludwigii TaxID=299767 RepID=UPI003974E50C